MNIKKYLRLESDLSMAKIELKKRFIALVEEEFGVQFEGVMEYNKVGIRPRGEVYLSANYEFTKPESFQNDFLTLDQIDRFIKVIKKLEEVE